MVRYAYALTRAVRRQRPLGLNLLLMLGVAVAGYLRLETMSPTPADVFMQSVAIEDADLGWSQLCPTLQSQLPRDALEQQTSTQRMLQAQQGDVLPIEKYLRALLEEKKDRPDALLILLPVSVFDFADFSR